MKELTKTETELAILQIMKRAETVIDAADKFFIECRKRADAEGEQVTRDTEIEYEREIAKKVKDEFEIPYAVHFFWENGLEKSDLKTVRKYASKLANGTMTNDQFNDMLWFFEEMAECDWGFIFIETPLGYYDGNGNCPIAVDDDNTECGQYDAAVETMREIATRKSAPRPKPKRTKKKKQADQQVQQKEHEIFF